MKVYQTEADADALIVSTALNFAYDGFPTVIIGNDTDLLVMLLVMQGQPTSYTCLILVGESSSKTVQHLQSAITTWTCYLSLLALYA